MPKFMYANESNSCDWLSCESGDGEEKRSSEGRRKYPVCFGRRESKVVLPLGQAWPGDAKRKKSSN